MKGKELSVCWEDLSFPSWWMGRQISLAIYIGFSPRGEINERFLRIGTPTSTCSKDLEEFVLKMLENNKIDKGIHDYITCTVQWKILRCGINVCRKIIRSDKLEFGQTQDFSLSDRMSDKSLRNFARSALTLKLISNEYNFTLFIGWNVIHTNNYKE